MEAAHDRTQAAVAVVRDRGSGCVGDIVVWDNAALLHSATLIDPEDARTLWRVTVLEVAKEAAAPQVLAPAFGKQAS